MAKLNYWELEDKFRAMHILQNRSVVPTEEVQKILRESQPDLTDEAIQDELDRIGMRSVGAGKYITSEGIYNAETGIYKTALGRAQETSHHIPDDIVESVIASRETIREEQANAVRHVAKSGGVSIVEGAAGVGKSFAMGAVREAFEKAGYQVLGAAPAASAARELGNGADIDNSDTMYALYQQITGGQVVLDTKSIIIVDEAGMSDSKTMARIANMAHETGAKLVAIGDRYQLEAVGSASLFAQIGDRIGRAEMKEIARQEDPELRKISLDFFDQNADQAFKDMERLKLISTNTDPVSASTAKYMAYTAQGKDTVVLAGTNKNVSAINHKIIQELKEKGELNDDRSAKLTLEDRNENEIQKTLYEGQKIMFRQGDKKLDISNGDTGKIIGINGEVVSVEKSDGSIVDVDTSKYKRIEDGYAMTVHKSQGITVDKAVFHADKHTMNSRLAYVAMTRAREGTDMVTHPDELVAIKFKAMESGAKESVIDVMTEEELAELNKDIAASVKAVEESGQDLKAIHSVMRNDSVSEQKAELADQKEYAKLANADLDKEMDADPSKTFADTAGDLRDFDPQYPSEMAKKMGMDGSSDQTQNFIDRFNAQANADDRIELPSHFRDGADHSALHNIRADRAAGNTEGVEQGKGLVSGRLAAGSKAAKEVIEKIEATQKKVSEFIGRDDLDEKAMKSMPSYFLKEAQKEAIAQNNEDAASLVSEEVERRQRIGERYSEMGSEDLKDRLATMNPEIFYDLMVGNAPTQEDRERNSQIFFDAAYERLTDQQKMAAIKFAGKYNAEESAVSRRSEETDMSISATQAQNLDRFKASDLKAKEEKKNLETLKTSNQSDLTADTQAERVSAIARTSRQGVQRLHERNSRADTSTSEGRSAIKQELAAIKARQELLKNDNSGSIQEINGSVESYRRDLLIEAGRDAPSMESVVAKYRAQGNHRRADDIRAAFDTREIGYASSLARTGGDSAAASRLDRKAGKADSALNQRLFRDKEYTDLQNRFDQKVAEAGLTEIELKEIEKAAQRDLVLAGNVSSDLSDISAQSSMNRGLTSDQRQASVQVSLAEIRGEDYLDDLIDGKEKGAQKAVQEQVERDFSEAEIARFEYLSQSVLDVDFDRRVERLTDKGASQEKAEEHVANNLYAANTIRETASNIADDRINQRNLEKAVEETNDQDIDRANQDQQFIDEKRQENEQHLKNLLELEGKEQLQKQIEKMEEIEQRKLEKMEEQQEKLDQAAQRSDERLENLNKEIERHEQMKSSKQDIQALEDERVLEVEKNEDLHTRQELMEERIEHQREKVESMEEISQQVERLDQEMRQQEEERLNMEKAEAQRKIEEEAQRKADEINQLKEDESEYQDQDEGIELVEDQKRQEELREETTQSQTNEHLKEMKKDIELQETQSKEIEIQDEEEKRDQDEKQTQGSTTDQTDDQFGGSDTDDNNSTDNKEENDMNYSQVNAQKADDAVAQAQENGTYEEIKVESFNRDNSDMLSMLSSDIKNQKEQKLGQSQGQAQGQSQDQAQKQDIDESEKQKQQQNLGM